MNKLWKTVMLAAILTIALAACGSGANEPEGTNEQVQLGAEGNSQQTAGEDTATQAPETSEPEVVDPTPSGPAEVIFYSSNNDPVESFDYRFGDLLRKQFPNYTITYIQSNPGFKLQEMVAGQQSFRYFFPIHRKF